MTFEEAAARVDAIGSRPDFPIVGNNLVNAIKVLRMLPKVAFGDDESPVGRFRIVPFGEHLRPQQPPDGRVVLIWQRTDPASHRTAEICLVTNERNGFGWMIVKPSGDIVTDAMRRGSITRRTKQMGSGSMMEGLFDEYLGGLRAEPSVN